MSLLAEIVRRQTIGRVMISRKKHVLVFLIAAGAAGLVCSLHVPVSQKISGAALKFRQAEVPEGDTLNPAYALDETKVGVAAKFIPIKPGEFKMGSPAYEKDRNNDEVRHPVKLTKGYEMQATEVTQLQYFLVMGRNPAVFREQEDCDGNSYEVVYGVSLCTNYPVESVSWNDAQNFIKRLNSVQNKDIYRLPSEAEWEYTARAGMPSDFPYSFGVHDTGEFAKHGWYRGIANHHPHAVAGLRPNQWGLYDMLGNVWEWVQDFSGDHSGTAVTDPTGPATGSLRVIRGGSWVDGPRRLWPANRVYGDPGDRIANLGFRLVRTRR
ncbi:MAG: formylglycine-generating enzyme family protein [bacterium]